MDVDIIYSKYYLNYSFGYDHPFWPDRAEIFIQKLKNSRLNYQIHHPTKATKDDLRLVHLSSYLDEVENLSKQNGYLSLDTPVTLKNLDAAYYSVGGSIMAVELAVGGKVGFNTLGGLHHAGISNSSGFCIFNDHAVAIRKLQKEGKIGKAFVFDLDVHAGNGTQEIFYSDPSVFTFSIHQDPSTLYPQVGFANEIGAREGKGFNFNIPLAPYTTENDYLKAVKTGIEKVNSFKPDLLVIVFGADTFKSDPLAQLQLEISSYYKIGKIIKSIGKSGLAICCAGGYSKQVPEIWLSYLEGLLS